ncbi:MAG: thiamine pyrophosphate-dependent dehydrogenase E1 component subunit alpha [Chloroflexi bacterium]|nr:thiamine pyrophosphate-dependent dehydrogenase E1 component subunit alpha [Chloroflexota bacterium]
MVVGEREARHVLGLGAADLRRMYYLMLLTRAIYQRVDLLTRQGKVLFSLSSDGHEAAQVGSATALRPGKDFCLPYYRDLGVVLTLGMTPREVMLNMFSREGDPNSGGRQMPFHWGCSRLRIITHSSPVATQIPHAVGIALASRIRDEDDVTVCYFGEGTTSKGDFHEGLNFAAVLKTPTVFICENNGYAISVPQHKQMVVADVAQRAQAYGIPGVTVDGLDVLEVYRATLDAVQRARRGEGPTLIEARVYRYGAHTSNDDDRRYRAREEVEEARKGDPVPRFRQYLLEGGALDEATDQEVKRRVEAEVDDATEYAEAQPHPDPKDVRLHVLAP